ncbi:SUKH-4 family immunity protein [Glycomyces sp. NPDC047010]|uniref:SUKH-4 family immunity protein n=1 Tax=Glycomyces sp. NPDC047010 TaxID=3155023 RepID=UPI0033E6CD91
MTDLPYPGQWQDAPLPQSRVGGRDFDLLAVDPGLSAVGVDRADGSVWLLPEGGEPSPVNASREAFDACAAIYKEAAAEAERLAANGFSDDEEDPGDAFTDALLERFAAVDETAVADENGFWSVAAEELGYALPL